MKTATQNPTATKATRTSAPASSGAAVTLRKAEDLKDLSAKTVRKIGAGIGLSITPTSKPDDIVTAIASWAKTEEDGWKKVTALANGVVSAPAGAPAKGGAKKTGGKPSAPAKATGKATGGKPSASSTPAASEKKNASGGGRESEWAGKHIYKTEKGKAARRSDGTRRTRNWGLIREGMKLETYLAKSVEEKVVTDRGAAMADLRVMVNLGHAVVR